MSFAQASSSQTTFTPDDLIAGDSDDILTEKVTLLSGQNCVRGTVLGKVTVGAVTAAADAGNTGNGVLSGQAVGSAGTPIPGDYRIVAIEPGTNVGTFAVFDPNGKEIGRHIVAGAAFNNGITFSIADGSTDFVSGDAFTITVAAGSGKYLKSLTAAVDGSQKALRILAQDADATSADAEALVYRRGLFNDSVLTYGTGHSASTVADSLLTQGIFLRHGQPAL